MPPMEPLARSPGRKVPIKLPGEHASAAPKRTLVATARHATIPVAQSRWFVDTSGRNRNCVCELP